MFDPAATHSPADPGERVFKTVLEHLSRDPLDTKALQADIAIAMRPKLESDRALMAGTGPLTFAQFAGLVQRVQGWKGDWLRGYLAIGSALVRRAVPWRQGHLHQAIENLLIRFEEVPGHIILQVPMHQEGDVTVISIKGWNISLNPEELAALRIQGVRAA